MPYFVRLRGVAFGPFEKAQVLRMRDTGRLGRTTDISEDRVNWTPAGALEWIYPPPQPAPTSPAPSAPLSTEWFYSVDGSEGIGPFSALAIIELIGHGRIEKNPYAWRQGENARPLRRIPEFAGYFLNQPSQKPSVHQYILYGCLAVLMVVCTIGGVIIVREAFSDKKSSESTSTDTDSNSDDTDTDDTSVLSTVENPKEGAGLVEMDRGAAPPALIPSGKTEDVVALVEPSIARIEGRNSGGSGFLIRPGILATNHHVIDAERVDQIKIYFPSASNDQRGPFPAQLLYVDPDRDIAFLSVQTILPNLQMVENYRFKRGQDIIVVGSPPGLENAINIGVLSSEKIIEGQNYYQLGISVNPGNSGGPVIDREGGRVLGIVTLKSTLEGIAFCIPAANVQQALKKMEQKNP